MTRPDAGTVVVVASTAATACIKNARRVSSDELDPSQQVEDRARFNAALPKSLAELVPGATP